MSGYGLYGESIGIMTDPRFRGDLLITDHIGLDASSERDTAACFTRKTNT